MKKFLSFMLALFCIPVLFAFSGCGESYSYENIKTEYQSIITKYTGNLFEDGGVDISYNTKLQTLIDNQTNQIGKLSNNISNGQAVFEPTLRASFENVSFCFGLDLDTSQIPQDKLNLLYEKLQTVRTDLDSLDNARIHLNEVAQSDGNVTNWIQNYFNRFFAVILSSCDFCTNFVQTLEEYAVIEQNSTKIQMEFAEKLADFTDIYSQFYLSEIKNEEVSSGQNICQKMFQNFLNVKDVLQTNFNAVNSQSLTESAVNVLKSYKNIERYNSLYLSNKSSAYNALNTFGLERLHQQDSSNPLNTKEQAGLNKVNEFLNIDCVNILNYITDLSEKITS